MENKNMFEVATRSKFRFSFRGLISVEDLWDLSLENLDSIFKSLNSQVKESKEDSLLKVKSAANETLDTMIEIVKYVVSVKLAENEARAKVREKKEQKQKILAILSEKQDAELHNKSVEELSAMLDTLDA
jgi:hypothetical protein